MAAHGAYGCAAFDVPRVRGTPFCGPAVDVDDRTDFGNRALWVRQCQEMS